MAGYIKTHSNYVLRKKHQNVSDGTIWERDITTIGGTNQFAKGQVPIYKSGNFIITVRTDGKASNQYNSGKWEDNANGSVWTLNDLEGLTSEFSEQNDTKIVLKHDYYDFRDFAYYGSLTEMFRASIADAIIRFPGELYGTSEHAYYTVSVNDGGEVYSDKHPIGDDTACADTETFDYDNWNKDYYVDNPFGIDLHSPILPDDVEPIKYFAGGGYKEYTVISDNEDTYDIVGWESKNFIKVVEYKCRLDARYNDDAAYREKIRPELEAYFDKKDREIWYTSVTNDWAVEEIGKSDYERLVDFFEDDSNFSDFENKYWVEKIDTTGDIERVKTEGDGGFFDSKYACDTRVAELNDEESGDTKYRTAHGVRCRDIECFIHNPCKGYKTASVKLTYGNGQDKLVVDAWVGDAGEILYLSDNEGFHIRPGQEYIEQFYSGCDNFQKLILNPDTNPKYESIFSVIKENERGYYREMETFIFPTSYGGYNIDASSYGFSDYTKRLSEIGLYYDELFTDNLYRSMTHEAIKNFDWSFTREFNQGDDEEYVAGGEKIQKALRVFAREFDEILTYIDAIKNLNRVTYDSRSNLPDYYLIDAVSEKGWDATVVCPHFLKETYSDDKTIQDSDYTENGQLSNEKDGKRIRRNFSQSPTRKVVPYGRAMMDDEADGYFITCCEDTGQTSLTLCKYGTGSPYTFVKGDGSTMYDKCARRSVNRIRSYGSETEYTHMESNNEFMRRMAINANHIWRHKGTLEGIETILAMFGLKSRRWVERMDGFRQSCEQHRVDYEITEYSSFTERLEERWDAVHQMYRMDWINSTKSIVYDYRSVSNYSKDGSPTDYISYQGLPVTWRYEYDDADYPYIKISELKPVGEQDKTSDSNKAFKRIDEDNAPVKRRYLYPNFEKTEQIDGDPYFQMSGGWLSKTVEGSNGNRYNFQYDVDDNIAYTCYVASASDTGPTVTDNHPIYKETVRNITRVDDIEGLLSQTSDDLMEGSVCYVSLIDNDIAVIDGQVFRVSHEYGGSKTLSYILLRKDDGIVRIGDSKFFNDTVMVYNSAFEPVLYTIPDKQDGYEIKAYINERATGSTKQFICQEDESGAYTIDDFVMIGDITTCSEGNPTNYFTLDDPYYSDRLHSESSPYGWRRLCDEDDEYLRINTIKDYRKGNNPHSGNMRYDGGHEYMTYFSRLFKHAMDNDLFDERCYESFYYDLDNEIGEYGFRGLIHDNEELLQYSDKLIEDSKIHYFGHYYEKGKANNISYYCDKENTTKINMQKNMYESHNSEIILTTYILNDDGKMINGSPYSVFTGDTVDSVTNQVMNNKRLTITFNLHNEWHTRKGQEELKYLDSTVMSYLTQMIPSTAIVDVRYRYVAS